MSERLEDKCRELIEKKEYETCEKEIADAMVTMPHSAVPHNQYGSVRHDPASGGKTPVCIQRGGLPDITLRVKS